jgi:hypothetical protein
MILWDNLVTLISIVAISEALMTLALSFLWAAGELDKMIGG